MTATPTLTELLELSLVPDHVYAPEIEQPDPYGWEEDNLDRDKRLAVVPKRTLRDRISTVEFIADTIESLDDSEMTEAMREELSASLVTELAGTRAKVDSTCSVLAMWDGLEASALKEVERLKARAEKFSRMRADLERHVQCVMSASKIEKLEGDTSTLSIRKNPPAVEIDPGTELLSEYLFYPEVPAPRPDKAKLKKALQAKRPISGVRLVQSTRLVRS